MSAPPSIPPPGAAPGAEASHAARRPARLGSLLLAGLLLKGLLIALLVAAAEHHPAAPGYTAPQEEGANGVVWVLARGFDAHAYQRLAREGYYDVYSRNYPMGFPLVVRGWLALTGDAQTAAVLAANVSSILALALFFVLARRYGAARGVSPAPAVLLFACTPGLLTFGTVAYSESTFLVVSMAAWWAWLRAGDGGGERRSLPWLALASGAAAASVLVRHMGGPFLVGLALLEAGHLWRVPSARRARALLEAGAALWGLLPVAAWFLWKFSAHDLAGLQEDLWSMRFSLLGGPASLVALGTAPEYVAQVYVTFPIALLLLLRLRRVDGRLALIVLLFLVEILSFTGIAAQSSTRYLWTLWPLSLGALALTDRAVVGALAATLFFVSAWCGLGHVLGTAAF